MRPSKPSAVASGSTRQRPGDAVDLGGDAGLADDLRAGDAE